MINCYNCRGQISETDRFCQYCGAPMQTVPMQQPVPYQMYYQPPYQPPVEIPFYQGQTCDHMIAGVPMQVTPAMDRFNFYRKYVRAIATQQTNLLRTEYYHEIVDLDSYLTKFPDLYLKYRAPILEAAMTCLVNAGIYDLSMEQFTAQHTEDFCLCAEDLDNMVESFNATIEANQERKANFYNMLPGVVFYGGIGAFAAAFATNIAVNKIAEADIKRANVNGRQRVELFGRINHEVQLERAFTDYWRVFLSLTWTMQQRGMDMWYPNVTDNQRAQGIFDNLSTGRIPVERGPEMTVAVLLANPYQDGMSDFLRTCYTPSPEIDAVLNYFEI